MLRILVRVQHDDNGHFQKIAAHYNRLWAANLKSADKKRWHQDDIHSNESIESPLSLFGFAKQVYTYEHIVKDSLKEDAKKYKKLYDKSINELKKNAGDEPDIIKSWDEEQNQLMQLTGKYQGFAPTLSGVMYLRRIQSQNMANSLHGETKIILAKKALGDRTYDKMIEHGLVRTYGSRMYSWDDSTNDSIERIQRVLDVLAQTEHLRWNASHELLGYKGYDDNESFKDEARLVHSTISREQDPQSIRDLLIWMSSDSRFE